MKATRSPHRLAVFSLIAALILAVALMAALERLFPGDPGEGLFDVTLVNDSSREVIIQRLCTVDQPPCQYTTYRDLAPGTSTVVATSDGNQDQHYRVVTTDGQLVGCLPLKFQTVHEGAIVDLSQAMTNC